MYCTKLINALNKWRAYHAKKKFGWEIQIAKNDFKIGTQIDYYMLSIIDSLNICAESGFWLVSSFWRQWEQ